MFSGGIATMKKNQKTAFSDDAVIEKDDIPVPEETPENASEEKSEASEPAAWDAEPAEETAPAEPVQSEEEKLRGALAELQSKYLYLQAEYQNYRKRVAKDIADARGHAYADALGPFMTVFDFLAMADSAAVNSDNIESIRQGLKMIIAEFNKAFDSLGVKPLDAVGKPFDPALHEAVAREASETVPEGVVIRQWSNGFKMGEKLLRPARVVVSDGAPETDAAADKQAEA